MLMVMTSCSHNAPAPIATAPSSAVTAARQRIEVSISPESDLDHQLGELADRVRHLSLDGMGSQLVARRVNGVTLEATRSGQPEQLTTCLLEVDPRDARRFGNDPTSTGFGDVRDAPGNGAIFLSAASAATRGASVGDSVELAGNRQRVDQVLPLADVVGTCAGIIGPGTVASIAASGGSSEAVTEGRRAVGIVWIDVIDDASSTALVARLTSALGDSWPSLRVDIITSN